MRKSGSVHKIHLLYTANDSRWKTFTVGIENDCSQETSTLAASFNKKCLWLVAKLFGVKHSRLSEELRKFTLLNHLPCTVFILSYVSPLMSINDLKASYKKLRQGWCKFY